MITITSWGKITTTEYFRPRPWVTPVSAAQCIMAGIEFKKVNPADPSTTPDLIVIDSTTSEWVYAYGTFYRYRDDTATRSFHAGRVFWDHTDLGGAVPSHLAIRCRSLSTPFSGITYYCKAQFIPNTLLAALKELNGQ